MVWAVGMADDENQDSGASRGKKRKNQKASKGNTVIYTLILNRQQP